MKYEKLKEKCDKEIEKHSQYKKRYIEEIQIAKRFYESDRNLYEEMKEKKDQLDNRYIIPFLLGFTKEVIDKDPQYIQVSPGASGGIDVDSDFQSDGRERIYEYLVEKYGEECVLFVGTSTSLGVKSAAKDVLRVYDVDYRLGNEFTKSLDASLSWEENLKILKVENPKMYKFYTEHKEVLDIVPHFINKIRQSGKHAGGMVILPKPVYNYIPVNRVSDRLASAFPESGQEQVLDELGVVKFDILGVTALDVMKNTIDMIDEKMYLIEDDDGIKKIVSESYINKEVEKI